MTTPEEQRQIHYDFHTRHFPMEECSDEDCRTMTVVVKTLRAEPKDAVEPPRPAPDTTNDFMVSVFQHQIVIMRPVAGDIDRDQALRLAAWLVAMVEVTDAIDKVEGAPFEAVLEAVRNT